MVPQVMSLQAELSYLQSHLTPTTELSQQPPPQQQPQVAVAAPAFSMADLPTATPTAIPATYDLSSLFDPMGQTSWAMQQRGIDPRQYLTAAAQPSTNAGLHAVARELLHRQHHHHHGASSSAAPSSSNASSSLSLSK